MNDDMNANTNANPTYRMRRDVSTMASDPENWHPDILWYAYAVGAMMNGYDEDPRSWRWQANVHGSGSPNPDAPPVGGGNPEWNQCPHGGWFFLPWHRAYLYYFEQIVGQVVKKLGGPDNWALPYWNYTRVANNDPASKESMEFRRLPAAFRQPRIPDLIQHTGGPKQYIDNPLYDCIKRSEGASKGYAVAWELVDPTMAMGAKVFPGVLPKYFGSKDTGTQLPHDEADFGALESIPHNKIHLFVGGWMGIFVSPRDPIFWLHHANIDRLWPAWLARGDGRKNPESTDWLDKPLTFRDKDGNKASKRARDMLTTEQLGYQYDSLEVWTKPTVGVQRRSLQLTAAVPGNPDRVLCRAETGAVLGPQPQAVPLEAEFSAIDTLSTAARSDTPQRVLLTIGDVRADESPGTTYRVLLGANEQDTDLGPDSPYFVGYIDFFGAVGGDIHHHGGTGLTFRFDVTDQLAHLREEGRWDGSSVPPVVLAPVPLEPSSEDVSLPTVPPASSRPRYGSVHLSAT
ncbi:tyrosinase family protein [Streptomyces sp. NPDC058000]|uniref:tyrosinase family protein n=1 Tax=Streptomyces sp. NPDC058000 TaxID=3346299 RepID=UPI0036EAD1F7